MQAILSYVLRNQDNFLNSLFRTKVKQLNNIFALSNLSPVYVVRIQFRHIYI